MGLLDGILADGSRWLVCVASVGEAERVVGGLGGGFEKHAWDGEGWPLVHEDARLAVSLTGVGKANAAGGAAAHLAAGGFGGVLSVGIGGALPGSGLALGEVVVGERCAFGDEGIETPFGFESLADMGFPVAPGGEMGVECDGGLSSRLAEGLGVARGVIATVSMCSGTDELAAAVAARTGGVVEAMEGAAVGLAALRTDRRIRFCEVRVVSNTTGDRLAQCWDLAGSLTRLGSVAGAL